MKKILFICSKEYFSNNNKRIHFNWVDDCKNLYIIDYWGKNFNKDLSLKSLQSKIDYFKPDFIYLTHRRTVCKWLPDLTSIVIPKIFVEVDNYKYDANDPWYKQFTKLLCRQSKWFYKYSKKDKDIKYFITNIINHKLECINILKGEKDNTDIIGTQKEHYKKIVEFANFNEKKIKNLAQKYFLDYNKYIKNIDSWENIFLFRWSVPEKYLNYYSLNKNNIYFIARSDYKLYPERNNIRNNIRNIITYADFNETKYIKTLNYASALICPTECLYGDFVPAKLFEYATSGAAILTNCDLKSYNMEDLDKVVIKYTDLKDLKEKLSLDFIPYYGKSKEVIKNHTHKIRYKELFGE